MRKINPLSQEEMMGRLKALDRSQATIEFDLDGTILTANENFLKVVGYSLAEVQGEHHRMFVDADYAESQEYRDFWQRLNRGEYQAAEYQRFAKNGASVWIQASYNPILDKRSKVYKIIKFATDISAQKLRNADSSGQIAAINKSQAVIEFNMDGTIVNANENFLNAVGYHLEEVAGRHHRMFVTPDYAESSEYRAFWEKLTRGEYQAGEYKRVGKNGREIWIQASYNPIMDMNGKPFKVVKYATDVTGEKLHALDTQGQIKAINAAQAVIHFNMDSTIVDANPNFLNAMGYQLHEIKGQHHSMFVDPGYAASNEYREFWARLNRGEYQTAEFKRMGKGGREVWIQASYNPIMDMNGKPFKVVKYATEITGAVTARQEVSTYSGQTLMNVQTVASAAEELTASIAGISQNTMLSKTAVSDIQTKATEADVSTAALRKAAQDMDNVVQLIASIAGQINLLALNATIESARAGEAGKGFAVVATEVKNLASQTTIATQQISREIKSMQGISNQVADILGAISKSVNVVTDTVNDTANAIEQQGLVTREISASMQTAAAGVANINDKIRKIAAAA